MNMQDVAHSAPMGLLVGLPLPYQPRGRADRLLAGMQRLQALYDEMAAKVIAEMDAIDAPTYDLEPSLGFLESTTTLYGANALNQADIAEGVTDDREEQCEGGGADDACEDEGAQCDDEGMRDNEDGCACEDAGGEGELGWSEDESAQGPRLTSQTFEYEPSLGSLDGATDQRRWAFGGAGPDGFSHRDFDLETQCEDEGGQCDDEGEIDYGIVDFEAGPNIARGWHLVVPFNRNDGQPPMPLPALPTLPPLPADAGVGFAPIDNPRELRAKLRALMVNHA